MAPAPTLTIDQYFRTPESVLPTELIYGALRVAEAPTVWHQQAVGAFHLALAPHVRSRRLGRVLLSPVDVVLDPERHLVMQPDLLFVAAAREQIIGRRVMGSPDLVLEVLSPNPRIGTLDERVRLFAHYGVREIWLLHQSRECFETLTVGGGIVTARRTLDYHSRIASGVLPDFTSPVEDILSAA